MKTALGALLFAGLVLGPAGAQEPTPTPDPFGEAPDPFGEAPDPFGEAPDPFGEAPDPFGEAPDPFGEAPDPFGEAPDRSPESEFDPDQVDLTGPAPGFELHGRVNATGSYTDGLDPVEELEYASVELSSLDVYAQWFPLAYLGAVAEIEVASELENDRRELEVELELGVLELRPLGDDRVRLRLGHMPIPFGLERRYYAPPRNELANRPAVFRRLFPGTYSDTGAFGWGRTRLGPWGGEVELELGLSKGLTGPLREDEPGLFDGDDNHEPQLSGRLGWTLVELDPDAKVGPTAGSALPIPLRLTLGASVISGHYDDDGKRRFLFQGYDLELRLAGLRLRGELVWAEFEPADGLGDRRRGFGLYGQIAYHHTVGWQGLEEVFVAFRYDRVDPDRRVDESFDVERYHWGLGWVPYPGFLVKLGYERATGRSRPGDTVFLELGFSF